MGYLSETAHDLRELNCPDSLIRDFANCSSVLDGPPKPGALNQI